MTVLALINLAVSVGTLVAALHFRRSVLKSLADRAGSREVDGLNSRLRRLENDRKRRSGNQRNGR